MKKLTAMFMTLCLCAGLCACGNNAEAPAEAPAEPVKQVPVLSGISVEWLGETEIYTVGLDMEVNEFGQISRIDEGGDLIDVEYNEDNLVARVNITDGEDGGVAYESFVYDGIAPVASENDPNSDFFFSNSKVISAETDENGRIIKTTEETTFTDPENGSQSYETNVYELEYDENGRVAVLSYYSDGEFDHLTEITYDEYGNMTAFSNKDEGGSEYLRFEFSYSMVDESEVSPLELDPFSVYNNWSCMINHIL